MRNPIGPFMVTTLLLITFLLLTNYAFGKTKSQWLNENPCMIKSITTSVTKNGVTTVTKEEVLKCKDGYDGPNYWERFAQFYYSGLSVPPYCRQYARPNHPFKTPGMICLSEDGDWEKQ